MEKGGGTPRQWFLEWTRSKHLSQEDRTCHEMWVIMETLQYMGCYDQLNLGAMFIFGRGVKQSHADARTSSV